MNQVVGAQEHTLASVQAMDREEQKKFSTDLKPHKHTHTQNQQSE